MRDFVNRAAGTAHIPSASIGSNTTTNGTGVDLNGKNGVVFVLSSGAYTDGTFTPNVQVSDNNSSWSDASSTELLGTETAITAANTVRVLGVATLKRYARLQVVSTSVTTGAVVGCDALTFTS